MNKPNYFIENFKQELEKVKNAEFLIDNEITQIKIFLSKKDSHLFNSIFSDVARTDNRTTSVFDLSQFGSVNRLNEIIHEYILNGSIQKKESSNIFWNNDLVETGILFAEYYEWLKKLKLTPKPKTEFSNLNNEQKLLALHFLGLDLRDYVNIHSATLLSQILNIGSENIRKNLSLLYAGKNDVRNVENFDKLIELFENKTFEPISAKLKKERKEFE